MDKADLVKLARQYFIADSGLSTANLIRKIQLAEGHVDCYATGKRQCAQMNCRWRDSCLNDAGAVESTGQQPGQQDDETVITVAKERAGS